MRHLFVIAALALTVPAFADQLTIERIVGDPALSGPTPRNLQVAPDGSRVTFVRGELQDQHQLDLWEYNLKDDRTRLLVDSKQLLPEEHLSDAEKARRERERTAAFHGIVDYAWAPDGSKLLFPLGDELYLYDLAAATPDAVRKLAHPGGAVLDPKISPKGGYVSYVRDQDLYVIDLKTGVERRLTNDGGGTIHNGEAEFVAQEEMDRSEGYWWAPDDSAIAFERYDEAPVPVVKRFEIYPDRTAVIEQRYPAAGDANVQVRLGLVAPTGSTPRWIDLGADTDIYLARVNWLPDSKALTFQRLTRDQQRLDLVAVDAGTLSQKKLLSETSKTWVNLNDDLRFLDHKPAFVWASERSGYKQLYLYRLDGKLIRPLSRGKWNIDDVLALDEAAGRVYFASNKDGVIERQLYTVGLDGRDAEHPVRISQGAGLHEAHFARDAKTVALYAETFSDPQTPPQVSVHAPDGHFLAWIEHNRLDPQHPYWPYRDAHIAPEFGTLKAEDGQALYYQWFKPRGFDPAKRYPVFIDVYGGPHVQVVENGWVNLFDEYMAQQGYVVFSLDNRGSERRGRAFSDAIFHRLGDVEVRDQRVGIHWLQQQAFVDAKHIGVFGWSYGGYISLSMLAKDSAEIAAGVAVAPVTDWRLYDTCYTERYLGRPADNAAGYVASGVFPWLDGLTSPLLLAHGMADDNVLFLNSTRLMAELQSRGTQFELMTYPGGKHGLSTPAMHRHVYHTIQDFFDARLKRP